MGHMRELLLRFADAESLLRELDQNLSRGRAFVADVEGIEERTMCTLVLVHPIAAATLPLTAEAVYVQPNEPGRGVGLKLDPFDAALVARLREFAEGAQDAPQESPTDELIEVLDDEETADAAACLEEDSEESKTANEDHAARTLHERLRRLSITEQQRVARNGTLPERVMLERIYGPAVWETLLSNTRLSIPEVARIAKKGTLPRPLVEVIAAQAAWVSAGEVQRALLANPRSSVGVVTKVLRAMPRTDLARVPQQTAYPMAARQAAKKLLGG